MAKKKPMSKEERLKKKEIVKREEERELNLSLIHI